MRSKDGVLACEKEPSMINAREGTPSGDTSFTHMESNIKKMEKKTSFMGGIEAGLIMLQ